MGAVLGIRHQKATGGVSPRWVFFLCISCFCLGVFVVNRFWTVEPVKENENASFEGYPKRVSKDKISCEKMGTSTRAGDILNQVSQAQDVIMTLDKTISSLEMQLAAARAVQESNQDKSPVVRPAMDLPKDRPKVLFVMGIMTAFSSRNEEIQSEILGCLKE